MADLWLTSLNGDLLDFKLSIKICQYKIDLIVWNVHWAILFEKLIAYILAIKLTFYLP